MAVVNYRQRKGLSTLFLIVLAESVYLTNAVTFWNQYNTWSARHQQHHQQHQNHPKDNNDDTSFESSFTKASAAREAQECANDPESCPAAQPPAVSSTSTSSTTMYPRPQETRTLTSPTGYCLQCMDRCVDILQHVRGGHGGGGGGGSTNPMVESVMSAVGSETNTAVAPYGIPLNAWKIIFQAMLTLMNVACWLIPLKSKKMTENKLALSLANAFSGGVFLSLAFGHLIPECVHGFHGMNEATPYMLALGGYLLIFFVEKVAFDTEHILHEAQHSHAAVAAKGKESTGNNSSAGSSSAAAESNALSSGRGAVILLGALAVHSILEMAALGLADTFGDSALLTLSIALHQPAESIALLVAFIKSGLPEADIIKYLSIFSAMGPIGVGLGMAVNEFATPIVDSIMLAVVAGTFIYVGATEVIPEEFEEPENKWKKFFALVSGILSIFAITQYTMTLES